MYEQSLNAEAFRSLLLAAKRRVDTFKNLFCNHSKRIKGLGKNLAYWLNRTVNKSAYTNKDSRKIPFHKITLFLLILTGRLRFFSHISLLFRFTATILSKCNIFNHAIKAKQKKLFQSVKLFFLLPTISIIDPNDIVFSKITARLYLNQFKRSCSGILKTMKCSNRNIG